MYFFLLTGVVGLLIIALKIYYRYRSLRRQLDENRDDIFSQASIPKSNEEISQYQDKGKLLTNKESSAEMKNIDKNY